MSCQTVRKSLSAFLDSGLAEKESNSVAQHLAGCRDCAARSQELLGLRRLLRDLPVKPVPFRVASQLRVLASHERVRRVERNRRWQSWMDRLSLVMDNLMRPVAIPFAGGVASAVFLFSILTPTLTVRANVLNDVPTALYTEPVMVQTSPFNFYSDEVEVELTIDRNGQITDFSCPHGKVSRELAENIGNMILFSSFNPATLFGQPTSGKIRVSFKHFGGIAFVRG